MLNKTYDCVVCYCDELDWRNNRSRVENSVRGTPETLSNIYEQLMSQDRSANKEYEKNPGKHWAVIITDAVSDTGVSDYVMEALVKFGVSIYYKNSLWSR